MSHGEVTIREAAQIEVLLGVALAFVAGLLIIFWGFQTYQFGRIIRDTPTEPVRSIAIGRTEVDGAIRPYKKLYERPFTDGECVHVEFKVREYKEYPDDDDKDDEWKTVQRGQYTAPFYLDDGTGEVLVEPNDETIYEISDEHTNTISVGKGDSPPPAVQEFLSGYSSSFSENGSGLATALSFGQKVKNAIPGMGTDSESRIKTAFAESLAEDGEISEEAQREIENLEADEIEAIERGERAPPPAIAAMTDDGETNESTHSTSDEGAGKQTENTTARGETDESDDSFELVSRSELGSVGNTSNKRQYVQKVLPAGDDIYVFGGATRRDPEEIDHRDDAIAIRTDPSTDEFIISDYDEFQLARGYTKRSIMYIGAGIIASAMILALLAQILLTGPLFGIEAAMP